jgi:phosphoribosyl 1,2-cyclic phosphate phosphodiesterase
LKNKFTILGSGSSLGSPWITNYWGKLDKQNKKNKRTRCCAHIKYKNISILIDTSPDIKKQIIDNKIDNIDAIIYTHEHADQTSGIFEMRPFYWKNKKRIHIYGSKRTVKELKSKYNFCFHPRHGYKPIMKAKVVFKKFKINKKKNFITITPFDVEHGLIKATGYVFEKIGYLSDCNYVSENSMQYLKNLDYLIVDCLRYDKHPSHFNFDDAMNLINLINPKKTILTNLHVDVDYSNLKKKLPKNIIPAYDGLSFNF